MDVTITTLAERPWLGGALWEMPDPWPEFMRNDPVGRSHIGRIAEVFPEFTLVATDGGEIVARAHSVPFALGAPGRGNLPAGGWDQVLIWAFADHRRTVRPDLVSAIEIAVSPGRQGHGLSRAMLTAMRDNARALGFRELVAPIRPTGKHREPATPMEEYARRTRDDGLPVDPWLRTHVRAGGVIDSVAPVSMVISGSLTEWREWTGHSFGKAGWVEVTGALVPVRCVPEHDYAVYVEPNIWVRHGLT
jgi:GNAT superfamily N-acetyltransferase